MYVTRLGGKEVEKWLKDRVVSDGQEEQDKRQKERKKGTRDRKRKVKKARMGERSEVSPWSSSGGPRRDLTGSSATSASFGPACEGPRAHCWVPFELTTKIVYTYPYLSTRKID